MHEQWWRQQHLLGGATAASRGGNEVFWGFTSGDGGSRERLVRNREFSLSGLLGSDAGKGDYSFDCRDNERYSDGRPFFSFTLFFFPLSHFLFSPPLHLSLDFLLSLYPSLAFSLIFASNPWVPRFLPLLSAWVWFFAHMRVVWVMHRGLRESCGSFKKHRSPQQFHKQERLRLSIYFFLN